MKKLFIILTIFICANAVAQPVMSNALNPIFNKNLIIKDSLTVGDMENDATQNRIMVWDSINMKINYRQVTTLPATSISEPDKQIIYGTGAGVTSEAGFEYDASANKLFTTNLRVSDSSYLNGSKIKYETMPVKDNTQARVLVVDSVTGMQEYRDASTIAGATDLSFSGASSPVTLNSSTGTDVTFTAGGINTFSATGSDLTITATEVDGSVTNELQTIANTSDATSHTAILSNSGGSLQLVEGTNITLTTTGTSADGIVTIASPDYSGTFLKLDQTTPQTVSNGAPNFSGGIGVGTAPTAKADILSTTEQLRLRYDASNFSSFTVNSTGGIKFNPSGNTTTAFNFTKADGTTSILNIDATNTYVGITQTSPTSKLHITTDNLGATTPPISAGIYLQNTTPSTAILNQNSPAIIWEGQSYATTPASSYPSRYKMYVSGHAGTTIPYSTWKLSSINPTSLVETNVMVYNNNDAILAVTGNLTTSKSVIASGTVEANLTSGLQLSAGVLSIKVLGNFSTTYTSITNYYKGHSFVANKTDAEPSFSTDGGIVRASGTLTQSSLGQVWGGFYSAPTINQTGTATGLTYGFYNNPTLTSAVDFYAFLSTAGKMKLTGTPQTGSMDETFLNLTNTCNTSGAPKSIAINLTNTASGTGARLVDFKVGGTSQYQMDVKGKQIFDYTYTAPATTGAQTIDKVSGSVNFAAAATSLVVTNSLVTTNSIVMCQVSTNDATMTSVQCVIASGSFTLFPSNPPTAETKVTFFVIN